MRLVLNQFHTSFYLFTNELGIDHLQGQGILIPLNTCSVTFDLIIPKDLKQTPYIMWVSTGEHNHAPPPIHKVPNDLQQDIINLFIQMNDPNLTISETILNLILNYF